MSQVKSMKIHIEKDCQNIVALKIDETPADLLPEDLVVGTRTKTGRKTAKNRRRALRSTKWYARWRSVRNRPFIIGDFPTLKAGRRTFRGSNLAVAVKKPKRKLRKIKISVYNARARAHITRVKWPAIPGNVREGARAYRGPRTVKNRTRFFYSGTGVRTTTTMP